jgi:hypothetical protein
VSAHTPWTTGKDFENCGGGFNVVDARGVRVAHTSRAVFGGEEMVSEAQAQDHARLIAAAPDLLAAHHWIAALASGWDEDGALGPKYPLSWESVARMAMDYARAAVAKAEGR